MDGIVPHLRRANKRRLLKEARKCTDRQLRIRYWTVVNLLSCLRNPTSDAGEHKAARSRLVFCGCSYKSRPLRHFRVGPFFASGP